MTFAIVRFTVPGLHRWPDAPTHRQYLANQHRHVFHVECGIEVRHNDRELEFHDLLDAAEQDFVVQGDMSCEMAARCLVQSLQQRFPRRSIYAEVFEDGECGARMTSEDLNGVHDP